MPLIDIRCVNGHLAEAVVRLSDFIEDDGPGHYQTPVCGECGAATRQTFLKAGNVIDDTLTGGARWMHNLGDQPIFVRSKSELKRIMQERGLVFAERNNYCKDDKSPWATETRLRPGQRDPFIHPTK